MKKRTLIFYLSKIIWKSAFYFGFVSKKVARATASKYKAETNAHILIYKNGYSFQFLSPLFSLEKFSHYLTVSQITQPIFKSRKFSLKKVVFLTIKTDRFNSRNGFKGFPQKIWSSLFKRVFNLEMLNEFIFSVSADYGDEKVI